MCLECTCSFLCQYQEEKSLSKTSVVYLMKWNTIKMVTVSLGELLIKVQEFGHKSGVEPILSLTFFDVLLAINRDLVYYFHLPV